MTDALVKFLNDGGYLPVFLPRTGYAPPDLYSLRKGGKLVRRDHLSVYLPEGFALPANETGEVSGFKITRASKKNIGAASSFLKDALASVGIGAPSVDVSFTRAENLEFAFDEVTFQRTPGLDHIVETKLDLGAIPDEYVADGKLHIVEEYLYARSLLMTRTDKTAFTADAAADLSKQVKGSGKVTIEVEGENTIRFRNTGPLPAFAYKAGRLVPEQGRWKFYREEIAKGAFAGRSLPYVAAKGVALKVEDEGTS